MAEKLGKYTVFAFYMTVLMLLFYSGNYRSHLRLPEGCDEFGYMNMAKAIANGNLFQNHCNRPFDRGLLEYLHKLSYNVDSLHFACPHAYWIYKTYKVVNQYPPGTGIVLSILPLRIRSIGAPVVFILLLLLPVAFAFAIKSSGNISFMQINLLAFLAFFAFISGAFSLSFPLYNSINSCAPSLGILLASGYLLDKRPSMSMALIGTSVVFRIANVTLFVPFLLLYIWQGRKITSYFSSATLLKAIKGTAFFLAGGAGFYLFYMWHLLGNPFSQTYPDLYVKLGLVSFREVVSNIGFFFNPANRWSMFHVFILTLIFLMRIFREIPLKWVVFSLGLVVYNHTFFILHWFRAEYYPYASGVITAGILLNFIEEYIRKKSAFIRIVNCAGITIIISAAVFSIVTIPLQDEHQFFNDQIKIYNDCFSDYDVVWAESRSGTIEYTTDKAGFRYQWGSPKARDDAISWLSIKGYRQAIWVSDLEKSFLDTVDVEKELQRIPVNYVIKSCPDLGTILEIK